MDPIIVCPESRQPLRRMSLESATALMAPGASLQRRGQPPLRAEAEPSEVLVRSDNSAAYPVVDGIPVLLAPEMLTAPGMAEPIDTSVDPYREAYEEMTFYEGVAQELASRIEDTRAYETVRRASEAESGQFPRPDSAWLDATFDCEAQRDAYHHLAPLAGERVLQLGGTGVHAVKFLLAGASEAWLLTPMLSEASFGRELAGAFGLDGKLHCVLGLGEQMPFAEGSFGAVFAGGCLHHTVTGLAIPEVERVLSPGGRFAAVEPWKAPLYSIGTRILGKREVGVNCRPIDPARAAPLSASFAHARVVHHGALSRYPLIALWKFRINTPLSVVSRITRADDAICDRLPALRRQGSSVALLATRRAA